MDILDPQTWLAVLLAAVVICLPGGAIYLLAARLLGREQGEPGAAIILGIGLSVAFWPLLLLYLSLAGLRFSPLVLWLVLGLSLLAFVWLSLPASGRHPLTNAGLIAGLTLAGLTFVALVFRLGDVSGLVVPMFGDSLHHTMIASIIADTGHVPGGYQPYVPVDTFTYHFGFHTLAAVLSQLGGFSVPRSVLLMGQVLMAASVPAAYLLGRGLLSSHLAGLGAALITGFVSVMPGYYVNFGRYTQLSGQILLPVAVVLLARTLRGDYRRHDGVLLGLCVAGLVVVHYRILIFFALFAIPLAVWHIVTHLGKGREIFTARSRVALAAAGGLLVASPWIWNLLSNYVPGLVSRLGSVSAEYIAGYNSLENLRRFVGLSVAAMGLLGVVLAVVHLVRQLRSLEQPTVPPGDDGFSAGVPPHAGALVLAGWAALTIASIWFPPGAIGSYTVALSLYLPLSALGGYALAFLLSAAARPLLIQPVKLAPLLLVGAPLLAWLTGTWHMIDFATYSYVREPDLRAFDWVGKNTPQGAKFLISSEISYAGRGVTASDAGMWLPLLAGRNVSVPALASWTEHPIESDFFSRSREMAALTPPPNDPVVQALVEDGTIPPPRGLSDPDTLALMRQLGITHVYSGTPGGASKLRLDLTTMRGDSCHYRLIYAPESGVYIFEVSYAPCK